VETILKNLKFGILEKNKLGADQYERPQNSGDPRPAELHGLIEHYPVETLVGNRFQLQLHLGE